jgi:hypothetical protein
MNIPVFSLRIAKKFMNGGKRRGGVGERRCLPETGCSGRCSLSAGATALSQVTSPPRRRRRTDDWPSENPTIRADFRPFSRAIFSPLPALPPLHPLPAGNTLYVLMKRHNFPLNAENNRDMAGLRKKPTLIGTRAGKRRIKAKLTGSGGWSPSLTLGQEGAIWAGA